MNFLPFRFRVMTVNDPSAGPGLLDDCEVVFERAVFKRGFGPFREGEEVFALGFSLTREELVEAVSDRLDRPDGRRLKVWMSLLEKETQ